MKKLIFIIIALILFNCSKESNDSRNCYCDVKIIIVDGDLGITGNYTLENVLSDCNGNIEWDDISGNIPDNHWFDGVKNCN